MKQALVLCTGNSCEYAADPANASGSEAQIGEAFAAALQLLTTRIGTELL